LAILTSHRVCESVDFYANILSGSPKVQNKPAMTRGRLSGLSTPQCKATVVGFRRTTTWTWCN